MLFSDNSVLTKPHAVMRRYELLTETILYLAVNDVFAKQGRQLLYSCRKHSVFFQWSTFCIPWTTFVLCGSKHFCLWPVRTGDSGTPVCCEGASNDVAYLASVLSCFSLVNTRVLHVTIMCRMTSVAPTLSTYFLNVTIFGICASGKEDGHRSQRHFPYGWYFVC
jgi:hypothetical protein